AYEDRVEVEESVYLSATDGPRRAVQIVVYGQARKTPRVQWTFAQMERTESNSSRDAEMEPELPL
ncbi:MAG: heparinase, partial [Xanthobacteraceae bacterium]